MGVNVPIHTLCPCSKEISKYGAHNQRARAKITIRSTKPVWIEELVEMAEASASSPIFSLLKRPDEKFVTEEAYEILVLLRTRPGKSPCGSIKMSGLIGTA